MRSSDRYRGRAVRRGRAENLDEALAALSADELREAVRDALERLDDGPRGDLEDRLILLATRGVSGWKPPAPARTLVDDARSFIAAACRVARADPRDVDDFLRRAITASLAGDHASARAVFEVVLEPICQGDIDLGQHEMVDEVLSIDLHECTCRLVAAAYLTTPLAERADAVIAAIDLASGASYVDDPVDVIAAALDHEVPELDAFLPLWIARLEREAETGSADRESRYERWLRAAVGRREGIEGLARLARTTKRVEAARAWCEALVEKRDWKGALAAYEECAALVKAHHARGELLDGAALAARELGRKDLPEKLEAAWLAAPSLVRLARWLAAGTPSAAIMRRRAAVAVDTSPTKSPRILGLLRLITGDVKAAATLLSKAPGLGWSRDEHPGHLLFPAFAWLLGGAPAGSARGDLSAALHEPLHDAIDAFFADDTQRSEPRLSCPSIIELLEVAQVARRVGAGDRPLIIEAMRRAASRRVDGVLSEKRRRHYGHAATLVACRAEIGGGAGDTSASSWLERLRARTSRFPAFQQELRRALGKQGAR
ncbi:hypothetical protein K2Z84_12285 [Candidatus Binatia bacterium]|nr:hypothetical protein [Candidatus Binatia bacterium]